MSVPYNALMLILVAAKDDAASKNSDDASRAALF